MGDPARLMGGEDKRKEEFSIRDCIGSFKQHQTFAHPQSLFATHHCNARDLHTLRGRRIFQMHISATFTLAEPFGPRSACRQSSGGDLSIFGTPSSSSMDSTLIRDQDHHDDC